MAKSRGGGSSRIMLGFVLGVATAALVGYGYLRYDAHRKAAASRPFAVEKHPVPASPRPRGAAVPVPPFGIGEDVFEAGARVYRAECARCHGAPGHTAAPPVKGTPAAVQFFRKPVTRQPAAIYKATAEGATGMPGYKHVLSDTEMWQVSLLLANAGKELPQPVTGILTAP